MSGEPLDVFDCPLAGTRLIEASAGTGKTWNICGLFLRLLLERGLDVQQILVVTFSKAATAELRERIRSRIAETLDHLRSAGAQDSPRSAAAQDSPRSAAAQDSPRGAGAPDSSRTTAAPASPRDTAAPGDPGGVAPAAADPFVGTLLDALRERHGLTDAELALRLDRAVQTFDEASIFTIHGFCQRALADTPFAAGLPMSLTLLTDDADLRSEVVHDFWRTHVAGDTLSPALASHLLSSKDSPAAWAALLRRRLAKPLSRVIWPAGLGHAQAVDADADALADADADADANANANANIEVDVAAGTGTDALAEAHATAGATWRAARDEIVAVVSEALPRLNGTVYKQSSVAKAAAAWDLQFAGTDPITAAPPDKLALFTPFRLKPKKGQLPPAAHAFFDQAGVLLDRLAATRHALATARLGLLRRLLTEGPARLRALKRERRVVAFDDMLSNLHEALCGGRKPWLAAALRARFPAALIDEFQDTDPQQFAIFQAIYAGSGAPLFLVGDPKQAIYSFRNADLHTYLQARNEAVAEYTLADNQRSTRGLIDALNGLFSANPHAFVLPGLHYRPVNFGAKPRPAWHDATAPRAPLQLWTLPDDAAGAPLRKKAARQAAAHACAGEIARLLGGAQRREVLLAGRPLAGGDIAVLVRSHAEGRLMRQALAALGVGSVELSQASVFDSPDAEDLQHLLAAILEPARDRLLRAALATDLLGFDAAAIAAMSADEPRLLGVVTRFTGYRAVWRQSGPGAMLRGLLVHEGIDRRLLARADGERRLTNLLHLAELLHQAADSHASPELLLRWLQSRRSEASADDAAQLRLESDRDLVQIVTVHKSKGLEYPVVCCPFLWDGRTGGATPAEGREYHDANGRPVLDFADDGDDPGIKAQIARERAAEHLRLIYVALTRAVHRCYLVVGSYTTKTGTAESGRSRLNSLVAGAVPSAHDGPPPKLTPADVATAWRAFAAAHPQSVGWAALPEGPWARHEPVRRRPETLAALDAPAAIPGAWWIGSYSSLSHGARHEAAAVDHDARVGPPDGSAEPGLDDTGADVIADAYVASDVASDVASGTAPRIRPDGSPDVFPDDTPDAALDAASFAASPRAPVDVTPATTDDDILDFPRGPDAGNCLHAVFERVDFADPATWPAAIATALREQPPGRVAEGVAARLPRMLGRMLADVVATPLPAGLALRELPMRRRLVELEFNLPVGHLSAAALAALLQAHGRPVPALAFNALEGYLRGFIDLVFEHAGRYYLLDWKSNHLGTDPAAYAAAPLARAMEAQGYPLQSLLYTLALHRYLAHRLPGYRYDDHFGGAIYLFVRGVRPGWAVDGRPTGVHFDRPPWPLVERLSALLAKPAPHREAA